jgi:retron-type reverse transcriptase
MLKLVRQWLAAGVEIDGVKHPTDRGVPQGGVISPLLANIVLHELDRGWERERGQGGWWVRYADDFVILCRTQAAAMTALTWVGQALIPLGLTLHPTKTRIVNVGDGRQGFEFLGFHCRKVRSWASA